MRTGLVYIKGSMLLYAVTEPPLLFLKSTIKCGVCEIIFPNFVTRQSQIDGFVKKLGNLIYAYEIESVSKRLFLPDFAGYVSSR